MVSPDSRARATARSMTGLLGAEPPSLARVRIHGSDGDPWRSTVKALELAIGQARQRDDVVSIDIRDRVAQRQMHRQQRGLETRRIEIHRVVVSVAFQAGAISEELCVAGEGRAGQGDRLLVNRRGDER